MKIPNEVVAKINRISELEKKILHEKGTILRWAIDYNIGVLFMDCLSQNLSGEQFKELAEKKMNKESNIPSFAWSSILESPNEEEKEIKRLAIPSQDFLNALSLKPKYEDREIVLWIINQGGAYLPIQFGNYQLQLYDENENYIADLVKSDYIASDLAYLSKKNKLSTNYRKNGCK